MPFSAAQIARQGLTLAEYQRICDLLGREPNAVELAIFGVMWSEHCSYKSSRVHLKGLPTEGPRVLQGPGENAGVIDIGEGWAAIFKIESHNHPSFVEPFQGAATGVGGILRDVFTMGARPIAIMDSLRFGPLAPGKGVSETVAARNQALLEGVVEGIAHYGNCFGVANLGGEAEFDPCYSGNPLVNAFALGIARRDAIFYGRASGVGNPVIYVGAKTGRDGIHGATMASEEFSEASESKRPNVQVGDPFLEKLLLEACLEAMATGAVVGIQDMGAAGLTSSSCEMGGRSGTGVDLDLDRVPQRETGMTAEEMMLSESQERMLLVAERGREDEVFAVFRKWGLDAAIVGEVTAGGMLRVRHGGRVVAEIPNAALTHEAPRYQRPVAAPPSLAPLDPPPGAWPPAVSCAAAFERLLASPNLAAKRYIYARYDTMVRTNTLVAPGAGAGVVRIKGTDQALAMALAGRGRYCRLAPREGARLAVAEAARQVALTGARPVAATNCLNFGNPEKPEVMGQLVEAIAGLGEACRALGTPITGGNVSLYNETLGRGIDPTPVVGIVGILSLAGRVCGWRPPAGHFRAPGEAVLLLGAAPPLPPEEEVRRMGATELADAVLGAVWGLPPALDLERERALHELLAELVGRDLIFSARQVGLGGLALSLAKCALARSVEEPETPFVGARLVLPSGAAPGSDWLELFAEHGGRVVVSCALASAAAVEELAAARGLPCRRLGETIPERLEIAGAGGRVLISMPLAQMAEIWEHALERQVSAEAVAYV
ncbi:MAG TPA: phosphoribosylformylglycinamidine synthase subunit PurL [Terriglobales bacterium]|nr:phosphoribosylformylglycinamidine synthase subunit PurL [Terriglobales bacterium]